MDRFPDRVTCVRCLAVKDAVELDRMLWCEGCRAAAQARAMDKGWWVGGVLASLLAAYIWIIIEPSQRMLGAWVGVTLAAFYLASRMAKEIFYGVDRLRNARATEAVPPDLRDLDDASEEDDRDGPPRISFRG